MKKQDKRQANDLRVEWGEVCRDWENIQMSVSRETSHRVTINQ